MKPLRSLLSRPRRLVVAVARGVKRASLATGRGVKRAIVASHGWATQPSVVANFLAASFIVTSGVGAGIRFGLGVGLMVTGAISGVVAYWVGHN